MTCIIVDDEPLARKGIEKYVSKMEHLTLLNSFENATDALQYLETNTVEILFLDVQMQEISGIEMLEQLHPKPITVLITANAQYASEAFNLDVIDYLVKPVLLERFQKAVDKATDFFNYAKKENTSTYTFVKVNKVLKKIFFYDIIYIEGLSNYVCIYANNEKNIVYQTIKSFEEIVPNYFCRIHKSYIVNLKHLTTYSRFNAILSTHKIPIGRNYLNEFRKGIENIL